MAPIHLNGLEYSCLLKLTTVIIKPMMLEIADN